MVKASLEELSRIEIVRCGFVDSIYRRSVLEREIFQTRDSCHLLERRNCAAFRPRINFP